MTSPNICVVGVGHLGRYHAAKLAAMPDVNLTALVDLDTERAASVAEEFGTRAVKSLNELNGQIDAAVIATPAKTHYRIARSLLERGTHVFVEKPLTTRLPEADHLVDLAADRNLVLQVGHIERFNPAWLSAADKLRQPKYIQAKRTGGFTFRAVDVGVVLDLMIHDIDIVLKLAASEVVRVEAFGISVLGHHEDLAQARLHFANGCIADLSASRLSPNASRTMNVFTPTMFANLDFSAHSVEFVRPQTEITERRINLSNLTERHRHTIEHELFDSILKRSQMKVDGSDALADEIRDFVSSVQKNSTPRVTGSDGRNAIAVGETVLEQIAAHRWDGITLGPAGPRAVPHHSGFQPRIWTEPQEVPHRKAG